MCGIFGEYGQKPGKVRESESKYNGILREFYRLVVYGVAHCFGEFEYVGSIYFLYLLMNQGFVWVLLSPKMLSFGLI